MIDRLRWLLITWFGLGLSPVAPGTAGTLGGVALAVVLQVLFPGHFLLAFWIAALSLFLFGCAQSAYAARTFPRKDPGEFVLDEVVGYLVTLGCYSLLSGAEAGPAAHAAAFLAFRVFDVLKPEPARKLEDLPGAVGIMADDQMAGVYAGLLLYLVLPLFGS
ncbi:MAG: hypothetical protein Fur0037_27730 [Planctomycetota bacterium]